MGIDEAEKKKRFKMKREYNMLLVLVVMLFVCAFISPTFRTVQNLINLLGHNAVYGLLSVGMAFVIITGGVDLSVGSVCALSGVLSAYAFIDYGFIAGVAAGLAIGIACGLVNGVLQTVVGMNHFVATLGMMTIARGAVYIITSGFNIYGIPEEYGVVGMGYLGPVPVAGIIWLVCVVAAFFVLKYTRFGQYVYAIGGNMNAAWLSGINTRLVKTIVYVVCGFFAGLAGVVLSCRTLLAAANAADTYELTAISACIVGGLSLDGGRGNVWGSVVGVLILGLILNIMQLTSVSSYWQDAVKGIIIIGAVAVDCMSKLKRD